MSSNPKHPEITEMKPNITVVGVGGGGGNAVNNIIREGLQGTEFVVANTDAQDDYVEGWALDLARGKPDAGTRRSVAGGNWSGRRRGKHR